MRFSRCRLALLSAVVMSAAVALAGCGGGEPTAPALAPEPSPEAAAQAQIDRGHMLIVGGLCHDCHTPKIMTPNGPEPDMSKMMSGHPESAGVLAPFAQPTGSAYSTHTNDHLTAWSGAWGVSFAANLTPDDTGIGTWTEDMFVTALKEGKHMGAGRPILPPMPWNWIGQMPDEDLKAMFAYLNSIPPVANRVPGPVGPDGRPIDGPASN